MHIYSRAAMQRPLGSHHYDARWHAAVAQEDGVGEVARGAVVVLQADQQAGEAGRWEAAHSTQVELMEVCAWLWCQHSSPSPPPSQTISAHLHPHKGHRGELVSARQRG